MDKRKGFLSASGQGFRSAPVMVAFVIGSTSGLEHRPLRLCLCCGEPTATRSIPACWDHWVALPEDLRSAITISYGRDQLRRYNDGLMEAFRIWRLAGLWRPRYVKVPVPPWKPSSTVPVRSRNDDKVVYFQVRRPKITSKPAGDGNATDGFEWQSSGQSRQAATTG